MTLKSISLSAVSLGCAMLTNAQDKASLDASIAKHRTGYVVVKAAPNTKVELEQQRHEFWFGAAIPNQVFDGTASDYNTKKFKEVFLENFNSAVTENALKWLEMEPEKGFVNYRTTDNMLEWTHANNIPLRGHNIYWGVDMWVMDWLKESTDEELYDALEKRGKTIAARYKGQFDEYDFNNEMIFRNYYEKRLGKGIIKKLVDWVREYDPEAVLYVNDFHILDGIKLDEYIAHIKELQAEGIQIDGIGAQGHMHPDDFDRQELQRSLNALAEFGLPIRVTEFNMPGQTSDIYKDPSIPFTMEDEIKKAKNFEDYYRICFAHPAVEGILLWGFWAGANWIPASSFYKEDWTPLPIADSYRSLVFDEWWTRYQGTTDEKGFCVINAFYGTHKVVVDGVEKTVELKKENQTALIEF